MSRISHAITRARLWAFVAVLVIGQACSPGDASHIDLAQIAPITNSLPLLASTSPKENTTTDKSALGQPALDAGFDRGWKGQYSASYTDPRPSVSLMLVTVDVYKTASRAKKRFEGERALLEQTFKGFVDAQYANMPLPDGATDCSGTSVTHPLIVPQYYVYCIVNTSVLSVQVVGTDQRTSGDMASSVGAELERAIRSKISENSR